jgi:hypothetical protein
MACHPRRFGVLGQMVAILVVLWPSLAVAAGVHALFDLTTPTGGPFPSDHFTVPNASHNTGRLVNLPKPDCVARPSDCADIDVINTLDGFNNQARLSIPFSGPIDPATVTSATVFSPVTRKLVAGGAGRRKDRGDQPGRVGPADEHGPC